MIRCFIIEDEPLAQDVLKKYIEAHPGLKLSGTSVDPLSALDQLNEGQVDLLFLDINLPKLSGISFYKSLSYKPAVVFTTAYPEFAIEGFEVSAVDYLVKPFSFERFVTAVEKVKVHSDYNAPLFLIIRNNNKTFRVPLTEILFIESLGDYVKIHTPANVLISSDTLKGLEEFLPMDQFARVHKSYIVSVSRITYLEGNRLKIEGSMIPVGYSYRERIGRLFKR